MLIGITWKLWFVRCLFFGKIWPPCFKNWHWMWVLLRIEIVASDIFFRRISGAASKCRRPNCRPSKCWLTILPSKCWLPIYPQNGDITYLCTQHMYVNWPPTWLSPNTCRRNLTPAGGCQTGANKVEIVRFRSLGSRNFGSQHLGS
jgi:hypothetical protein